MSRDAALHANSSNAQPLAVLFLLPRSSPSALYPPIVASFWRVRGLDIYGNTAKYTTSTLSERNPTIAGGYSASLICTQLSASLGSKVYGKHKLKKEKCLVCRIICR